MSETATTTACKYCGDKTDMLGTRMCDMCWSFHRYFDSVSPNVVSKFVAERHAEIERRAACYDDLLAACELALSALVGVESGMGKPGMFSDLPSIQVIRAAIAKAKGPTDAQ